MRIALSTLLLVLLALTALAGTGCKRGPAGPAVQAGSLARVAHLVQVHPMVVHRAEASHPAFAFCHPRADQLEDPSLTAAEAQIVFDLKANNDDRTEMIAADFARPGVPALPQVHGFATRSMRDSVWHPVLERPPRPAAALA